MKVDQHHDLDCTCTKVDHVRNLDFSSVYGNWYDSDLEKIHEKPIFKWKPAQTKPSYDTTDEL